MVNGETFSRLKPLLRNVSGEGWGTSCKERLLACSHDEMNWNPGYVVFIFEAFNLPIIFSSTRDNEYLPGLRFASSGLRLKSIGTRKIKDTGTDKLTLWLDDAKASHKDMTSNFNAVESSPASPGLQFWIPRLFQVSDLTALLHPSIGSALRYSLRLFTFDQVKFVGPHMCVQNCSRQIWTRGWRREEWQRCLIYLYCHGHCCQNASC